MLRSGSRSIPAFLGLPLFLLLSAIGIGCRAADAVGVDDLRPLDAAAWNRDLAAHLLERAGFGGTPQEIDRLTALGLHGAVASLVHPSAEDDPRVGPFDRSGIPDAGIDPFPETRPLATDLAKAHGEAIGVDTKPDGNRRIQPVVNKFFFWLRVSLLECNRIGYWWGNRMLATQRPLVEKMALFWHGHFATHEDKVRDYRKMEQQIELFQRAGLGNFRDLMVAVAEDPAMLAFLDAGVNVKGAPNENFAREIMEMFTMGVGHYSERDIREAARAFTGWNYHGTHFVVNEDRHDDGVKTVFNKPAPYDGVQVIDLILAQPATADYIAGRIYRYFVRDDLSPQMGHKLGAVLRDNHYEIAPLLEAIFLSRDFYSSASVGTRIKSPVEFVVSTYRKLGVTSIPGIPDFNETTRSLGQYLLHPPTVAGWAYGTSWITPGLLIERGNFVRGIVFPDFMQPANDRVPLINVGPEVRAVHDRIGRGLDITAATVDTTVTGRAGDSMAESNKVVADRDEEFNTRYGSYRGWQMAIEAVKPIPRTTARVDLTRIVTDGGARTTGEAVDLLARRFFSVPVAAADREQWTAFLTAQLGTDSIPRAQTYMEEGLRTLLHLMLSSPDYQLG